MKFARNVTVLWTWAVWLGAFLALEGRVLDAVAADGIDPARNAVWRQKGIQVVPRPAQIEAGEGQFFLTAQTEIRVTAATERLGYQLARMLAPATGFPLPVVMGASETGRPGGIELILSEDSGRWGEEGYRLDVRPDRVLLQAAKPAGVFYGGQTLRQLFPEQLESRTLVQGQTWSAAVGKFEDRPQFAWRGVMLDPARQFISKEGIRRCLDWMALYKLNRLHLHLTDVDGWRVEIKRYPRLTSVGAWADLGDGIKVGGFYTQDDLRELVAYAAERFITVIPEIETPSHSGAAMVAYPALNCFGTRTNTVLFGMDPLCGSEFCAGNEDVFEFLDGVFTEVAALFPGPFIHVGGDEAEMHYWRECPKCQQRHQQVGDLHGWFMERVKKMVESKGKRVIGWSGVAPGAVFTCWDNDGSAGWNAAKAGWDVVMSTGNNLYLNYNIERTTLKHTYDFDPAPARAGLTLAARQHILGVEGCLWGEMLPENHLDSQAFPRVLALAERGWGIDQYDFEDFVERVKVQAKRLEQLGILTGPAFGYPIVPTLPARVRDGLPPLVYPAGRYQNEEDWRWTLMGIDKGQGYDALHPVHAFDGDLETYHLSWGPRAEVDLFIIALEKPGRFDGIKAITGLANGDHSLRQGVLEVSSGYGRWREVARFENGVAEAKLGDAPVVAVRLRSTANQSPFALLAVREIILEREGHSTLKTLSPVERLRLPAVLPK